MKYGYIQLDPIIAEIQAQLKTMSKMGKFDTDDCYQYAVQCIRKIGSTEYDVREELISIKNHKAVLPKDFYMFEDVRIAEHCGGRVTTMMLDGRYYQPSVPLRPVDNTTTDYCSPLHRYNFSGEIGFSFKIPPGVLSCDIRNCILYVKYHCLKKDDKGNILMQDEENCIEAVKNFIMHSALKEDYLLQKIPRYIYLDIKNDYDESLSLAQAALQATGPDEINSMVRADRRKHDKFKL